MPTLVEADASLTEIRRGAFSAASTPILILGAGPAGLSIAFELKHRGLEFLILERGDGAGESWKNMPQNLKLVSPWKTNSLPGTSKTLFARHQQLGREEYFNYLRDYAKHAGFSVQTQTQVHAIEKLDSGAFRVQTSRGDFFGDIVVNATGYFSNPFVPSIPGAAESRIPQLHFADYRDTGQLRFFAKEVSPLILIIGKRLSAGQIMIDLAQAGSKVAISHRSPIEFGAEPWAWWFLFRLFPSLEWLKLKMKGARAPSNDVRMQGGIARKLVQSGAVKTFPAIRHFERDAVVFEYGQRLQPSLVLYATGFRPALKHLSSLDIALNPQTGRPELRDLESISVPGLYFLGLDQGRNFQSRFIRGIRKDAAFLADRLQICVSRSATKHSEPL